jgi:hypothetical protein
VQSGPGNRREGEYKWLTRPPPSARLPLRIPVGATLVARDNVLEAVKPYTAGRESAERELDKLQKRVSTNLRRFERRGNTARNRAVREVKRTRTRVERELRQRRNQTVRTVKQNRREVEKQLKSARQRVASIA